MINLFRAEFYKLFHQKGFWGMIAFSVLLSSLLLLDSGRKSVSLFFASLYNTPLLYFLTIIFCVLFIGSDFEKRTLYSYISAGHKRGAVLFAKMTVFLAACTIILILPLILHGVFGAAAGKGMENMGMNSKEAAAALCAVFTAVLSMNMLPFFTVFLFKDTGKTLVVLMTVFFIMIFLLNSSLPWIFEVLPMGQLRLLAACPTQTAEMIVGIDLLEVFVLYIGALAVFCRADLK